MTAQGGHVIEDVPLSELGHALERLGLQYDVKPTELRWLHRHTGGADWYMVCPKAEQSFSGKVSFRQKGHAELWNPMNGSITPIATRQDGDYTCIDLNLSRGQMLFVVFRDSPSALPVREGTVGKAGGESWTLNFPQGWGIDAPITLTELLPWKDLPLSDEGKAFSGTATYETTFLLDHKPKKKGRLSLNLGKVEEIAVVSVNGQVTDTLWAEPYETDITRYVRKGKNQLSIQVTSTWFNRLVYDARQPKEQRKTWVINGPSANSELRPSGLLGPVELTEWK